jgi:hypothetical protein
LPSKLAKSHHQTKKADVLLHIGQVFLSLIPRQRQNCSPDFRNQARGLA